MNFPDANWQWVLSIIVPVVAAIAIAIWTVRKSSKPDKGGNVNRLKVGGNVSSSPITQAIDRSDDAKVD